MNHTRSIIHSCVVYYITIIMQNNMKYIKMLSLLGFGCMVGLLIVFSVKIDAKNSLEKTNNNAKVKAIKPVITTNTGLNKNFQFSSKWNPQSNNINKKSNDNSDFYNVIIEYNIFRPLGWKPPNEEPEYTLLGTVIDTLGIHSKAYVLEKRSDRFHTFKIGDSVGDMVIREIEDKKIVLDKDGESITMRTRDIEFLKTGGSSSGRQARSGNYENSDENNERSSETNSRTGYRVTSKKNSVSSANQRNLKTITKIGSKDFKSLSKEQQIAIERKLKDMKLMKSSGKVTIEWVK